MGGAAVTEQRELHGVQGTPGRAAPQSTIKLLHRPRRRLGKAQRHDVLFDPLELDTPIAGFNGVTAWPLIERGNLPPAVTSKVSSTGRARCDDDAPIA